MKRTGLVFGIISHLFLYVGLTACCVIEHYAWFKMGMYRYLVLKNSWLLKNVFTPETLPFILTGIIIVMLFVLIRYLKIKSYKSYSFSYGALLLSGSIFLFRSEYFFSLRACVWFGLCLILSEIFFVLSVILRNE